MDIDNSEVHLLTEIGYASVLYGYGETVSPIFDALSVWLPNNAAGAIGKAINAIAQGKFDEAVAVLETDGVTKAECADEARAIQLLALFLSGRMDEAQQISEQLSDNSDIARNMASTLMQG